MYGIKSESENVQSENATLHFWNFLMTKISENLFTDA